LANAERSEQPRVLQVSQDARRRACEERGRVRELVPCLACEANRGECEVREPTGPDVRVAGHAAAVGDIEPGRARPARGSGGADTMSSQLRPNRRSRRYDNRTTPR